MVSVFSKLTYMIWMVMQVDECTCFYTTNSMTDSVPAVAVEDQDPPRVPLLYDACLTLEFPRHL